MEAKYYTPQISDIFIGFECELFYQDDFKLARTEKLKWHKTIIDKNKFQQSFSLIKVNKIRVKHLDREDIESLSWINLRTSEDNNSWIFKNNDEYKCRLILDSRNENDIVSVLNENLRIVFQGTIKNKSELQKLMVQLNIK